MRQMKPWPQNDEAHCRPYADNKMRQIVKQPLVRVVKMRGPRPGPHTRQKSAGPVGYGQQQVRKKCLFRPVLSKGKRVTNGQTLHLGRSLGWSEKQVRMNP